MNGDHILNADVLENAIDELCQSYHKDAVVRRLFIDEITAIPEWEIVLKRMVDRGKLANLLLVTTGSKANDLRRGTEKLPGRKGKLARTTYIDCFNSTYRIHINNVIAIIKIAK